LFINLTPFIPLSFSRRGGRVYKRGFASLWFSHGASKRGVSPSSNFFPLPFLREGGQGDRLLNNPIFG
jgi:hypothetical protein